MTNQNQLFTFSGEVQKNLGRGRTLGYPTANIQIPLAMPEGLFLGTAQYDDRILSSLIFIGSSVTFKETDKKAEVYILDFNEDIYGKKLAVNVIKKLRNNIKFTSVDALIDQMKQDELDARAFFQSLEK